MDILIAIIISAPLIAYFSSVYINSQYNNLKVPFFLVSNACLIVSALPLILLICGFGLVHPGTSLLNFYLDQVSYMMFLMTGLLSFTVIRFSLRYMDGDGRQLYFLKWLTLTVTSVSWFISAGNLITLFFSWLAVSGCLHKLLTFFADRPKAIAAARRKFIVSRIGDLSLLTGFIILSFLFNTFSFKQLFVSISTNGALIHTLSFQFAMIMISLGAIAKSAQVPFHSWLPETLEVPTPVSAIMHAGIINAGGYLIIRLSKLFEISPLSGYLLTAVGTITAITAMLIMVTQTSVKKRLAYSTIGQMGFMIMQCGLGFYALALLHILAHSFYKAYAFLRAGSAIEQWREQSFFPEKFNLSVTKAVLVLTVFVTLLFVFLIISERTYFPLSAVWASVFTHLLLLESLSKNEQDRKITILNSILLFFIIAGTYLSFAWIISNLLDTSVAASWLAKAENLELYSLTFYTTILFSLGFVLQTFLINTQPSKFVQAMTIHIHNGFYLKSYFDRFFQRFLPDTLTIKNSRGSI